MIDKLREEIDKYLDGASNTSSSAALAVLLHPMHKNYAFDKRYEFIQQLKDEVSDMHAADASSTTIPANAGPPPNRKRRALEDVFEPTGACAADEVDIYMSLPFDNSPPTLNNPLHFWAEQTAMFPALSRIAGKYLCVQASSTPNCNVAAQSDAPSQAHATHDCSR